MKDVVLTVQVLNDGMHTAQRAYFLQNLQI